MAHPRGQQPAALGRAVSVTRSLRGRCFDAQQAEKSLKALLIFFGQSTPRTHSIGYLLKTIRDRGRLDVPKQVQQAAILSDYAVTTRYPGNWEPVDAEEYREAVGLASEVYAWVLDAIQGHD